MASTTEAVVMDSTPTFEVIGTLLVAIKRERVFRRQVLALEYGVCRKAYSIYLLMSVPCVLSVYVRPSSVCGGRRPCLSVVPTCVCHYITESFLGVVFALASPLQAWNYLHYPI